MDKVISSFEGVIRAVGESSFGIIALAFLIIMVLVLSLMIKAEPWAKLTSLVLAIVMIGVTLIATYQGSQPWDVKHGENGSVCEVSSDCNSGYCYPGPHPKIGHSKYKYCIAGDRNCALPGFDGANYGTEIFLHGSKLECKNPEDGINTAQFY